MVDFSACLQACSPTLCIRHGGLVQQSLVQWRPPALLALQSVACWSYAPTGRSQPVKAVSQLGAASGSTVASCGPSWCFLHTVCPHGSYECKDLTSPGLAASGLCPEWNFGIGIGIKPDCTVLYCE